MISPLGIPPFLHANFLEWSNWSFKDLNENGHSGMRWVDDMLMNCPLYQCGAFCTFILAHVLGETLLPLKNLALQSGTFNLYALLCFWSGALLWFCRLFMFVWPTNPDGTSPINDKPFYWREFGIAGIWVSSFSSVTLSWGECDGVNQKEVFKIKRNQPRPIRPCWLRFWHGDLVPYRLWTRLVITIAQRKNVIKERKEQKLPRLRTLDSVGMVVTFHKLSCRHFNLSGLLNNGGLKNKGNKYRYQIRSYRNYWWVVYGRCLTWWMKTFWWCLDSKGTAGVDCEIENVGHSCPCNSLVRRLE